MAANIRCSGWFPGCLYFCLYWLVVTWDKSPAPQNHFTFNPVDCNAVSLGAWRWAGIWAYEAAFKGGRISSTIEYPNTLAAYLPMCSSAGPVEYLIWRWEDLPIVLPVTPTSGFCFYLNRGAWLVCQQLLAYFLVLPRGTKSRSLVHLAVTLSWVWLHWLGRALYDGDREDSGCGQWPVCFCRSVICC